MAADPAFLPGGQFWGQDEDQFQDRALHQPGLGIQEYAIGAHIAGVSAQLRFARSGAYTDRQLGDNSFAGPSIDLIIHNLEFAL